MTTKLYALPGHCCSVQVFCWVLTPSHLPVTLQFLLLCCTPDPHETEHGVQFDQDNHSWNNYRFKVRNK